MKLKLANFCIEILISCILQDLFIDNVEIWAFSVVRADFEAKISI